MKKIKALTPEQVKKLKVYRDKWIEIGLATEKPGFDRTQAENAVKLLYKCAGLPKPKTFIWTKSPLHLSLCCEALKNNLTSDPVLDSVRNSVLDSVWDPVLDSIRDSVRSSVRNSVLNSVRSSVRNSVLNSIRSSVRNSVWNSVRISVRNSVWDPVWDSVSNSVRNSVWDSVSNSVWSSVRDSVSNSVWNSVWDSVLDSVLDSVRDSVRDPILDSVSDSVWDSVRDSVSNSVWSSVRDSVTLERMCFGAHDAPFLSLYNYFQEVCGIDCSKLLGLFESALHCGWFVPCSKVVIISPRPYHLKTRVNERGVYQLDANGEPAVFYCEDFKIYAMRGVRMPEKYGSLHSSKWNPEWFVSENNAELKRLIAEELGYDKLFSALNAKKIDSYKEYSLWRAENVDVEPVNILQMTCPSTGKVHYSRVPPEIREAKIASAVLNFGIPSSSFTKQT